MASEHQNSTEWKRCTSNLSVRGLVLTKGVLPAAEVDAPPAPMAGELVGQGLSKGWGLNKDVYVASAGHLCRDVMQLPSVLKAVSAPCTHSCMPWTQVCGPTRVWTGNTPGCISEEEGMISLLNTDRQL